MDLAMWIEPRLVRFYGSTGYLMLQTTRSQDHWYLTSLPFVHCIEHKDWHLTDETSLSCLSRRNGSARGMATRDTCERISSGAWATCSYLSLVRTISQTWLFGICPGRYLIRAVACMFPVLSSFYSVISRWYRHWEFWLVGVGTCALPALFPD